jgi:hypothetical protein
MAGEDEPPKRAHVPRPRYPPGYFACRRVIARLKRFQDLIRHNQRWGHQVQFARRLDELIPKDTELAKVPWVIESEINKLMPIISWDLRRVGIPTGVRWEDRDDEFEMIGTSPKFKKVRCNADLISDYFELPREGSNARFFDMVIAAVDRGIGAYEMLQRHALRRKYNPLDWIAFLLALPILVLERAGIASEETDSKLVTGYAWIIRILIAILLGLTVTKLGTSIPWNVVTGFLK